MALDPLGILDAWRRHDALDRFLLAGVPEGGLTAHTLLKTGAPGRRPGRPGHAGEKEDTRA